MGSKTRIALSQLRSGPDLQEWTDSPVPPDPQSATDESCEEDFPHSGDRGEAHTDSGTDQDAETGETGDVIPVFQAFRPNGEPATAPEKEEGDTGYAGAPEPESGTPVFPGAAGHDADGIAAMPEAGSAPFAAETTETQDGTPPLSRPEESADPDEPGEAWVNGSETSSNSVPDNTETLSDPELLALLEQLSETLDNANRILAERPAILTQPVNEYDGIEARRQEPEIPAATPPEPAQTPESRRNGLMPAALTTALFLIVAGGGFWWFQTNPWLLEGWRNHDTALSVTHKEETRLASLQPTGDLGIAIPAAAIPSAKRAPERNAGSAGDPSGKDREAPARTQTAALPKPAEPAAPQAQPPKQAESAPGRGQAGDPIELGLSRPASQGDIEVSVMVQGVPAEARLTHGSEIGGGAWVLEEKDIEKAALVTPASFPPQDISLEIAYVKSDGAIPESRSIDITVESARASAKPESRDSAGTAAKTGGDKPEPVEKTLANTAIPGAKPAKAATAQPQTDESAGNRLSGEEEQRLLDRAQEHLERGDIASARLILDYAAHQGSRRAMIALGETYDPKHLAKHDIHGVRADITQAKAWYERASRLADR